MQIKTLGRFEKPMLIGEGVSSSVFRAFDPVTESQVAVKLLKPHLARDPISILRFKREIELTRQLSHPNIIKIFDLFEVDNTLALSMEFLKGQSLSEHIKIHGALSWENFQLVFAQLLAALKYCHSKKIIHRDIKPQNIFVDPDLKTTLIDFGISRITALSDLTQTGTSLGTPEYMAPELYSSSFFDPRSDIYALGVVAYEMLTGQLPFQGESLYVLFEKQTNSEAAPLSQFRSDIPPWIEKVIHKMIRKDMIERYQTASDVEHEFKGGEYFEATQSDIHQQPCLKCQENTPISFTVCLNCGFDPTNTGNHKGQLFTLYLSTNNRVKPVSLFLENFYFVKAISISKAKPIKLMQDVPADLVPIFKNYAKFFKVNLFAQKQGIAAFIKQHFGFFGLGGLLLAPYVAFVIFVIPEASRLGASLYYANWASHPTPDQMFWITINSLPMAIDWTLKYYVFLPETLFPVLALCILVGCSLFYCWKFLQLFSWPLLRNWKDSLGSKSVALAKLSKCLNKQGQLKIDEHKKWGKKFLLLYLSVLKKITNNSENHQTLFSLINTTFNILSLMDTIRQSMGATRPSDSTSLSSLAQLEEAYSDAAIRLMTIDSLLNRISRNTAGQKQDLFLIQMSEAKQSVVEADLALQTLNSLNTEVRIAA